MCINVRNASRFTPSTALPASQELTCIVCTPTAAEDFLRADSLPGQELTGRSKMSFEGSGGVTTVESAEVVPDSWVFTCDRANWRAPKVPLVMLTDGKYKPW